MSLTKTVFTIPAIDEIYFKLSFSNQKEIKEYLNGMESFILGNKKIYENNYFDSIINHLDGLNGYSSTTFDQNKENNYLIEKLLWLKERNIRNYYRKYQRSYYQKIKEVIPEGHISYLDKLVDSFNDMESDIEHRSLTWHSDKNVSDINLN